MQEDTKKRGKTRFSSQNAPSPKIFNVKIFREGYHWNRNQLSFQNIYIKNFLIVFWSPKVFLNEGQLRPPVTRPKTPFGTQILNHLDMRIHQVVSKIHNTYGKNLSKSRLSAKFLGVFLVISELGSRIYIAKSGILIF